MEQLRLSIKQQEEKKITNRLTLLQQQIKHPLNEFINEDFVQLVPRDNLIWQILINVHTPQLERSTVDEFIDKKMYSEITFEQFVNECMKAIIFFHLHIMDFKLNLRIVTDSIQTLQEQIITLKDFSQLKFEQPNRLIISYVRHKSLKTDIFKYYKLKYKVSMNQQEQKSIYACGDSQSCFFPILDNSKSLHFSILGKKIDGGTTFEILSRVDMALDEVLISFDLKTYSKEKIKPCYLTLDYKDDTIDAPFQEFNPIELKFTLSMPAEQRIDIMTKLRNSQMEIEAQYQQQIEQKSNSIKQIIQPYEDLVYEVGSDLKLANDFNDGDRTSCSSCKIF